MKLYIMRHGPAEDQADSGRDFDRVLTASGRERTRLVAAELGRHGEAPKRVLSSPLSRALETAQLVAEVLAITAPVEVFDELAPGANPARLVRRTVEAGGKRVMVVGHEPDLSSLAHHLVPTFDAGFDKSMVLGLQVRPDQPSHIRFLLDPKTLAWKSG